MLAILGCFFSASIIFLGAAVGPAVMERHVGMVVLMNPISVVCGSFAACCAYGGVAKIVEAMIVIPVPVVSSVAGAGLRFVNLVSILMELMLFLTLVVVGIRSRLI